MPRWSISSTAPPTSLRSERPQPSSGESRARYRADRACVGVGTHGGRRIRPHRARSRARDVGRCGARSVSGPRRSPRRRDVGRRRADPTGGVRARHRASDRGAVARGSASIHGPDQRGARRPSARVRTRLSCSDKRVEGALCPNPWVAGSAMDPRLRGSSTASTSTSARDGESPWSDRAEPGRRRWRRCSCASSSTRAP